MCIAAPAKIVLIDEESNICAADFGGVRQNARLDLLPDAKIGDYVLIHAGYAIEKLAKLDSLKWKMANSHFLLIFLLLTVFLNFLIFFISDFDYFLDFIKLVDFIAI